MAKLPGGVLVLAAHPDDETVGAGGLLARLRSATVVHLTDGAPRDRRFWPAGSPESAGAYAQLRRRELDSALAEAGLAERTVVALGATDQDAACHLAPLAFAFERLLAEARPALVITHPYEGGHPDHDAAAFVARAAVALLRRAGLPGPRLVEMTSYHARGEALETGAFLPVPGAREVARRLSPELRARKERMLDAFESQRAVLQPFRAQIEVELFRDAPAVDVAAPPHPGALWYERLGFGMTGARWRELARRAAAELGLDAAGAAARS